mgnify:CR=1 FL=1
MAGHLPPALAASFESGRCLPVLMLRVDLPAIDTLALLYGTGEITWGGVKFVGKDDRFGSLMALDPPEDGVGDNAPSMSFEIATPNDTAAALLASPLYQGARTRLWVGGLDAAGALLEPYLLFDGSLDRPLLHLDKAVRSLEFDCVSGFEKFFADTEGQRLADASHQAVWPGEQGLIYVTGISRTIIWGPGERPGNGPVYGSAAGFGNFGGGGGGRGFGDFMNVDLR